MKGHTQSNSSSNVGNGSGSKGGMYMYGLMVVLAFGAAMFGGMLLHKLRDTQVLNLLLSHKDRHLLSLQLLLQKERDYMRETKRKGEEMKAKIYSLRTRKTELESKISTMQSTITSLKEELRTMESMLEEKQNEIKMLREKKTDSNNETPQVKTLSKTLKQRESEHEDSKRRFSLPFKVWSVSTDDPSNPAVSLTDKVSSEDGEIYRENNSTRETSRRNEGRNGEKVSREGEKRRRFFNGALESDRAERIQDGELKRVTERQDHEVVNVRNEKDERNGTSNLSKEFQGMDDLHVNVTGEDRKQKLDEVRELEEPDTDFNELDDSEVEEIREVRRVVSKKSSSKLEEDKEYKEETDDDEV